MLIIFSSIKKNVSNFNNLRRETFVGKNVIEFLKLAFLTQEHLHQMTQFEKLAHADPGNFWQLLLCEVNIRTNYKN